MLMIFSGSLQPSNGFNKFQFSGDLLNSVKQTIPDVQKQSLFELEIRRKLGFLTFQDPEKIADGVRFVSDIELWNEIVLLLGATATTKKAAAKSLKTDLSLIIERRNKIAHEGDLQPGAIREVWPIEKQDLVDVSNCINKIVQSIDTLISHP
jgi:hypothetical protein